MNFDDDPTASAELRHIFKLGLIAFAGGVLSFIALGLLGWL
jgi:hypothetical protein